MRRLAEGRALEAELSSLLLPPVPPFTTHFGAFETVLGSFSTEMVVFGTEKGATRVSSAPKMKMRSV